MSGEVFIGKAGCAPPTVEWTRVGYLIGGIGFDESIERAERAQYEAWRTTDTYRDSLTLTVDSANWRALTEHIRSFGWIGRRGRRMRGYNPETPARSAMHGAYRAKTRRRGKR